LGVVLSVDSFSNYSIDSKKTFVKKIVKELCSRETAFLLARERKEPRNRVFWLLGSFCAISFQETSDFT
jgi:hypothetical protein